MNSREPPDSESVPQAAAAALMSRRFRGYLPVAIDVETGGFHAATDALLEIAATLIDMDADGALRRGATHDYHVKPFEGARLDPLSLSVTGIDPHPSAAAGAAGARRAAAHLPRNPPRGARLRLPPRDPGRP